MKDLGWMIAALFVLIWIILASLYVFGGENVYYLPLP